MKRYLLFLPFIFLVIGLKAQQGPIMIGPLPNKTGDGKNAIYTAVEKEPDPKIGMTAYSKYVAGHLRYPSKERANGVHGWVIVQLIVERNGSLTNLKVLRTPSEALSKEAIRLISTGPKWNPGMQKGEKVRVQYVIPVKFVL
jgi:protein TonB